MKKFTTKLLSIMLCFMLAVGMSFTFSDSVYAAGNETTPPMPLAELSTATVLNDGASITAPESAEVAAASTIAAYLTPEASKYTTFSYSVNMPQAGTLVIQYAPTSDSNCYVKAEGSGASIANNTTFDTTQAKLFYVPSAGNVKVSFSFSSGTVAFSAWYVADGKAASTNGTEFLLGSVGSNSVSTFSVTVPSNGYLSLYAANGIDAYSISMQATGFKGWEYLSSSNGYSTSIGVKKGTYTISLRGAAIYDVSTTFHSVKETSAKTSKKKAASIKKGKANKAIIPANNLKKVHWYKIKNPKNQKLTLAVNGKNISGGGNYGKLKITVYFPDKTSRSATLSAGYSDSFSVTYGPIGTKKARKGTYYVKVVSENGGNGYYTLKWK